VNTRILDAPILASRHFRREDGLIGNVCKVDAIVRGKQSQSADKRSQSSGGAFIQIKATVIVQQNARIENRRPSPIV
jgi:hypothetical protein